MLYNELMPKEHLEFFFIVWLNLALKNPTCPTLLCFCYNFRCISNENTVSHFSYQLWFYVVKLNEVVTHVDLKTSIYYLKRIELWYCDARTSSTWLLTWLLFVIHASSLRSQLQYYSVSQIISPIQLKLRILLVYSTTVGIVKIVFTTFKGVLEPYDDYWRTLYCSLHKYVDLYQKLNVL